MGRRAVVLLVALVLAGLAAWAVWNFLQGVQQAAEEAQVKVTVFRAVQPIAEGAEGAVLVGNPELIAESEEEVEDLPADAIQSAEELNAVLTGRVAAGPISANAVLTRSQWTEVTLEITPLADLIPSGKQAFTVSTDMVRGVNGFVEAGDRLNMIVTLDISFDLLPPEFSGVTVEPTEEPTGEEETETTTITYTRYVLQGIPVLAVGREARPDPDAPTTVEVQDPGTEDEAAAEEAALSTVFTLEVTPEQAERIAFAFENGSIWLTLVPQDFVEVETSGVIIDTLFGGDLLEDIFGTS